MINSAAFEGAFKVFPLCRQPFARHLISNRKKNKREKGWNVYEVMDRPIR